MEDDKKGIEVKVKEYLEKNRLLTDGSFGTYYAEKYQTEEICEVANTKYPKRVLEIHRAYIQAGAKLIRTNTFASNTVALRQEIAEVKHNISAAVALAKQVAAEQEKEIYIAGDIGPIPNEGGMDAEELREQYEEILHTFLAEGIRILTFETFSDMDIILPVIKKLKQEQELFVMVQFSVNQYGYSNSGLSAKKLLQEASEVEEIDAVGLNCGIGPGHMEQILKKVSLPEKKYLIALPNAGYPKRVQRQIRFGNTPSYFSEKVAEITELGVTILGGCCGTNPDYIRELSDRLADSPKKEPVVTKTADIKTIVPKKMGFIYDENGKIKEKKLIAVELAPPANADDEKILEAAHMLQKSGADVLTFPDSPSGRTRVDSVLMARKVKLETGLEVMPHICCRDKNAIAMRSTFLGAHINGIYNMLIITGDPVPSMVRQTVKPVFNFDSVGLMKIAQDMNEDTFMEMPLAYGGAINQGRRNLEVEIGRVKKKMEAGAEFFLTQPVFSKEDADRVRRIKEETGARILCGIMPLISKKNALFMKNEIAGVPVTDEIVARYPENATKEEGEAVGVAIAKEMMAYTQDFVDGYYFSFPFNKVYLLKKIME